LDDFNTVAVMLNEPILHVSVPVDSLENARRFYIDVLGCRLGRERDDWFDVWFFGMQVTLQLRPMEVRPYDDQGVSHFGVVLRSRAEFDALVARLDAAGTAWISRPDVHADPSLSGKLGGKLADPSGNLIELKYYDDVSDLLAES
jgi:extradiol dioxygenase family protein